MKNQKDFLKNILFEKRLSIKKAKEKVSQEKIITMATEYKAIKNLPPGRLYKKLNKPGPYHCNIIAEIKFASPSKGIINEDLNIEEQAKFYEEGGASAISVLTEQKFFKGAPEYIKRVKRVSTLPVLRKDFIISSYQIYESILLNADAILLIVACLSENQLKNYIELCKALSLDALIEVHCEEELKKALKAGANIIGINNRNLKTFNVDIQTSIELQKKIPKNIVKISESGIKFREDIVKLIDNGIFNFLIGESLVRSNNPKMLLKKLIGAKK